MAITKDERGDRWLVCDMCHTEEPARFYGIGLGTAKLVRDAAHDLGGWVRRKVIVRLDPYASVYADLCVGCQQPEVLMMNLLFTANREPEPEAVHP